MTKDKLVDEFTKLAKRDIEGALSVATGLFVGLNLAYVEMRGEDPKKQITIESGEGQRRITIHAA